MGAFLAAPAAVSLASQAVPTVGKVAEKAIETAPSAVTAISDAAYKNKFLETSSQFVTSAATGTTNVASKAISSTAHATFSIAEKMLMGSIIVMILIILVVGVSLLVNQNWKSGFVFTLFGVIGAAGMYFWTKNPATADILGENVQGRGEDDEPNVVEMNMGSYDGGDEVDPSMIDDEIDFEELEGDIDYLEIEEDKKKKKVKFSDEVKGAHEENMSNDLKKLIMVINGTNPASDLREIETSIENTGKIFESNSKEIVELIEKTMEKKGELITQYQNLKEDEKNEVKRLLGEFKKLSSEVRGSSHDLEGKLDELSAIFS
jgi:hypothetical protein